MKKDDKKWLQKINGEIKRTNENLSKIAKDYEVFHGQKNELNRFIRTSREDIQWLFNAVSVLAENAGVELPESPGARIEREKREAQEREDKQSDQPVKLDTPGHKISHQSVQRALDASADKNKGREAAE